MSRDDSIPSDRSTDEGLSDAVRLGRRPFIAAVGAAAFVGGSGETVSAAPPYVVEQGGSSTEITPLSGDVPVEDLLQYQLEEGVWDGDNGARDDGGPYYSIIGAEELQRDNTSILFLYDGPNGLSLVTVHGHVESGGSEGGSITFSFTGMPADGEWAVKDDLYLDPDTGEPAGSNYDNWNVDGTNHTIDWTYGDSRTDGGAFRGLGDSFAVTIDPAFNEESELYGEYYDGDLTDWEVLSGDLADPDRTSLEMDQQVTLRTSDQSVTQPTYTVTQGDTSFEVTPFSGDETAEELYDLRFPSGFEGDNGAVGTDGPTYQSVGTEDLQVESTTITFLYDGPNGLSLVTVHDMSGGDGGSATWTVTGVPSDADWVVKDDLYLDPDTGEPAGSNYDRWYTDGTEHTIDWTWGGGGTDGGVLRPLGNSFAFTIDPAFNEQATLWEQHYSGDIVDWQFLSGSRSNPDRTSLSLTESVTVSATQEETNEPPAADAGDDRTVDGDTEVALDASGSSDPDGDDLTYSWTQTDGPSVDLSDADTATPTFTAPTVSEETTLAFEVEVSDGNGGSDTAAVSVTVTAEPTEPADEHTLVFDGNGAKSTYEFTVTGEVLGGEDLKGADGFSGNSGSGAVYGWKDTYTFTGELESVSVTGGATVRLDGEEIDPGSGSDPDDPTRQNKLVFDGNGAKSTYEFTVSGEVLGGEDLKGADGFSGSSGSGAVYGWKDTYTFTGELESVSVTGGADVYLNGEKVDPAEGDRKHTLVFDGSGEKSTYEFTVSGEVLGGEDLMGADGFSGNSGSGAVWGWKDTYTFTGDVESVTVNGNATVYVDGDEYSVD